LSFVEIVPISNIQIIRKGAQLNFTMGAICVDTPLLIERIDDAQSLLGYVLSTKLFFRIRFSSASRAHPSQEGLWWTEGSCSGVSIITTWATNQTGNARVRERRECIPEVTYKCGLQSRAAYINF